MDVAAMLAAVQTNDSTALRQWTPGALEAARDAVGWGTTAAGRGKGGKDDVDVEMLAVGRG